MHYINLVFPKLKIKKISILLLLHFSFFLFPFSFYFSFLLFVHMDAEGRNIQRLETAVRELEGRLCRLREELGIAREKRRLALALALAVEEGEEETVVDSRGVEDGIGGGGDVGAENDDDGNGYGDEDRDKERQCSATTWSWPMKREEYKRYGRQLIMPEIGIGGMIFLLSFQLHFWGFLFLFAINLSMLNRNLAVVERFSLLSCTFLTTITTIVWAYFPRISFRSCNINFVKGSCVFETVVCW